MEANLIGKGQPRNKAKLRDGAIVEYDEAMDFDPENPEPRKPKAKWEIEYQGVGVIMQHFGREEGKKLHHFWKYLNAPERLKDLSYFPLDI